MNNEHERDEHYETYVPEDAPILHWHEVHALLEPLADHLEHDVRILNLLRCAPLSSIAFAHRLGIIALYQQLVEAQELLQELGIPC